MFVIDFQTKKIKELDNFQICDFVNNLIDKGSKDLIGKRYLFLPDAAHALYILEKAGY